MQKNEMNVATVLMGRHRRELMRSMHRRQGDRVGSMGSVTRVGSSSVGHRERAWLIGRPVDQFILDVAAVGAALLGLCLEIGEGAVGRAACASAFAFGILGIWAAELVHEIRNDAVEMDSVVETYA